MAHGERAQANGNGNREYSNKRPCKWKFPNHGKISKNNTHRLERKAGRKTSKEQSDD